MQERIQDISLAGADIWPVSMENTVPAEQVAANVAERPGLDQGLFALARQFAELDQTARELQRLLGRYAASGRRAEALLVWMNANAAPLAAAAQLVNAGLEGFALADMGSLDLAARTLEAGPEYLAGVNEAFQEAAASLRQIGYDHDCRLPQATHDRDLQEACTLLNGALDSLEVLLAVPQAPGFPLSTATRKPALSLV